ncbi:MAG TPA: C1 family peptidase [Candidatus Limnocylindrales bacterium]|nr:C1 family peptidase [Candidatus Limnocylindrales bacterium]
MPKTNVPDQVRITGRTFDTNALPDPFDAQDLVYRPKLQPLDDFLDRRAGQVVLDQIGQSCTGHAVAALINTVNSTDKPGKTPAHGPPRKSLRPPVSPYMLYWVARKYDEFPGTEDLGSSLRGALKGWYYHGVCAADDWGADVEERDLFEPDFVAKCLKTPLGAYYRVNARRIDDMQSALTELNAIVVSAAIHDGWIEPKKETKQRRTNWVIREGSAPLGGHAFLLAGYNDIGFLIQNSWGESWGRNGYATLPYDDWLDNAYDAWVARPGVPQTGVHQRRRVVVPTGATIATGTGPDLARLQSYVINVAAGGQMSPKGRVSSSPDQIKALATTMEKDIETWANDPAKYKRRLVLYAHGGLVGEDGGVEIANRMVDWWRANHIYPIHVVWESDAVTTILSFLEDVQKSLPFGGIRDGIYEAVDRLIEGAGRNIQRLWEEMKENARMASSPRVPNTPDAKTPGVTLFVDHLKKYVKDHGDLEIHLVGHSAGSVLLAGVLGRLIAEGITVDSLQLMGGAISVSEFERDVLPHLAIVSNTRPRLKRFTAFDLDDKKELDDACPSLQFPVYHKSLLYFVARALEPSRNQFEKPMVGLHKSVTGPLPSDQSKRLLDLIGGDKNLIKTPTEDSAPLDSRSKATGHGEFDNDEQTMTSVLLRILRKTSLQGVHPYPKGGMPTEAAR